jgi:hypothetical protein
MQFVSGRMGRAASTRRLSRATKWCASRRRGPLFREWRISYTDFCYTMLELVSATYFSGILERGTPPDDGPQSVIDIFAATSSLGCFGFKTSCVGVRI